MKTTYIHIALLLLLSFSLQAQTETNEAYSIASALNYFTDDAVKTADNTNEKSDGIIDIITDVFKKIGFWEKFMQGDIRMEINLEESANTYSIYDAQIPDAFTHVPNTNIKTKYYEKHGKASLYAEFDWDNKAQVMILNDNGSEIGLFQGIFFGDADEALIYSRSFRKEGEASHKQYTDINGYWYVPVQFEGQSFAIEGLSGEKHVRFNAKQMAVANLNDILDLSIDLMTDKLASELIGLTSIIDFTNPKILIAGDGVLGLLVMTLIDKEFGKNSWNNLENLGDEKQLEIQKELKETIKALLSKELEAIGGFPVFIHWAFFYSPEVISAKYGNKVTPKPFDCEGVSNGCLKFTVKSGPDKGKSMTFDRQGRLKHINALKEGTATYYYDQDITVKIPEALDLSSYFGNKKRNQELYEEVSKKINKQNYEKELKTLKEELKSATSEEEKKEINDRIEDIEKRLKNEGN